MMAAWNVARVVPPIGEAGELNSNMMALVLIFAAAMIVFWVIFRSRFRRKSAGAAMRLGGQSADDARPPRQLDRWSVEMHETARDLSAQLDTKMVALQALIQSAEAKEARLRELIEQAEAARR
ncbi:MAG: hypothetical protein DWQ31_04000 [Planctomycetota bacterium]|mgnify:CR=1 FL=1|nr:MAG: hypothetical protein DWQ31_04000 [Planctomycetota bacterium]REJ94130.1 MAG: hypothetical protein DWQ35_08915 [Planctomycetota bacterium]REK26316.1 MAG: hypothetical protein DWQ42_09505 [Planctomycetota bacterium]REK45867.1 MAG: hypothetical protein DWQ46_08220 [Planctomycetota bacterium]